MTNYFNGQWLASITRPTFLIQVRSVEADGGISVIADGTKVNTSARYLRQNYRPLGDSA